MTHKIYGSNWSVFTKTNHAEKAGRTRQIRVLSVPKIVKKQGYLWNKSDKKHALY
jgi:hypothetical protein